MEQHQHRPVAATYLSKMSPNADVHVGGNVVQAKDGILHVYETAHEAEIDHLISTRPDWRQMFQKIDLTAADKAARDHIAAQRAVASRGASSSQDATNQRHVASGEALLAAELAARKAPLVVTEHETLSTEELGRDPAATEASAENAGGLMAQLRKFDTP